MPTGPSVPTVPSSELHGRYCHNADAFPNRYVSCSNSRCCPLPAGILQSDPTCSWAGAACFRPVLGLLQMGGVYFVLMLLWGVLWCCRVCATSSGRNSGQAVDQQPYARMSEVVEM